MVYEIYTKIGGNWEYLTALSRGDYIRSMGDACHRLDELYLECYRRHWLIAITKSDTSSQLPETIPEDELSMHDGKFVFIEKEPNVAAMAGKLAL